jgi:pilus assembly protein CpaF
MWEWDSALPTSSDGTPRMAVRAQLRAACLQFGVHVLRFNHPDRVLMQTRQAGLEGTGRVSLRQLVKESLRMRPSRIVIGEVRAEECLDLLLALNAGLPGMATLHANSAREALVKMCTFAVAGGER